MQRLHLITLAAALIAACGNGVPPDNTPGGGGNGGSSCATNADCSANDICVSGSCVALSTPNEDAGTTDQDSGGMEPVDSGSEMPPMDAGSTGTDNYCGACTNNSECGGTDNFCVGSGFCGVVCHSNTDCPVTATCVGIGSTGVSNCYPVSGSCSAGVPDAGTPTPDAGHPDAGHPDAGPPDAGHPDAGPPDAGSTCTTTWANTWSSWFSTTCTSCHQHSGQGKSFADSSSALQRMQSCSMPQGGPCVTTAELTAIQAWEACGSP